MEELTTKDKEFKDLVHVIRGQQVKRNIEKFPNDFMFHLTKEEQENLKSQNVTSSSHGGKRKLSFVFTEQGIYMVATILKNDTATKQSIYIIREFKKMKHYLAENKQLISTEEVLKLSNHIIDQDKRITDIESTMVTKSDIDKIMDNFLEKTPIKEITFLEGQKFEANEAYISIYKQAKHTIYVIDNYVDIDTLSLLKNKQENVNVTIFTANKGIPKLQRLEVNNFDSEYPNIYVKRIRSFHDRYIILDYGTKNEVMYHCGHSSKDTGNKVSTIHKMLDTEVMHPLIDELLEHGEFLFR